jgi:hypothetical protein
MDVTVLNNPFKAVDTDCTLCFNNKTLYIAYTMQLTYFLTILAIK